MIQNTAYFDHDNADLRQIQTELPALKRQDFLCTLAIVGTLFLTFFLFIATFSAVGILAIYQVFSIDQHTTYLMGLAGACFFFVCAGAAFQLLTVTQKLLNKTAQLAEIRREQTRRLIVDMEGALHWRKEELETLNQADEIKSVTRVSTVVSRPARL